MGWFETKKAVIFFMLGLLIPLVLAETLTCQYKDKLPYEVEETRWYRGPNLLEGKPEITETTTNRDFAWAKFKVYNPFNFSIEVEISYWAMSNWYGNRQFSAMGTVMSKEYAILEGGFGEGGLSITEMKILQPDGMHTKIENVLEEQMECRKCNGEELCLNDGEPCSKKLECGGGFCVRGLCSNSKQCYEEDCKCDENEVQCEDNTQCVKKKSVGIGSEPICNVEECEFRYIDQDGNCAKPAIVIEQEEKARRDKLTKNIIYSCVALALIVVGGLIWWESKKRETEEEKGKTEEKKQETIQKQMDKLRKESEALTRAKQELEELENLLSEKKRKKEDIEDVENKINLIKDSIKNKEEDLTKPRRSLTRAFWEWSNPNIKNAYYPCYVDKDSKGEYTIKTDIEIHKDLAKKEIFNHYKDWFTVNYHRMSFDDLVVHHIDKDILNYFPYNLVIIIRAEHNKINHSKIIPFNWKSGIEELKRNNIKAPHIGELGAELETDPYKILGVERNDSFEEIKKAYYNLSSLNHPDKLNHLDKHFQIIAESRFKKINEAFQKIKEQFNK